MLAGALAGLLPDVPRTLMLRAALHEGPERDAAWRQLLFEEVAIPDFFRADVVGLKRLAPALHRSARATDVEIPQEWRTVLRTAYARETLRSDEYGKILAAALKALNDADIGAAVLTGAGLGHTAYPDPVLRHAHDIDLLIPSGASGEATYALEPAGFSSPRPLELSGGVVLGLVHDSLLPLLLHERFFRVAPLSPDPALVAERLVDVQILGQAARVPTPALALVRVCARAAICPRRAGAQWVVDAWHLLPDVDWDDLVHLAEDANLAAPACVFLEYLVSELGAPVPESTLQALAARAPSTSPLARDILLWGAGHHAASGPPRTMALTGGARLRHRLRRLFPSGEYLRWSSGVERGWAPALWVRRTLRGLGG